MDRVRVVTHVRVQRMQSYTYIRYILAAQYWCRSFVIE